MVYSVSVMKARIFYLTKEERRNNPKSWFDIDETIKNIKEGKINAFANVHEMEIDDNKDVAEVSEIIFELMNGMAGGEDPDGTPNPLGNPEGQQKIKNLGVGHTSMSVGDFIVFGNGKTLVVDDMGFKEAIK